MSWLWQWGECLPHAKVALWLWQWGECLPHAKVVPWLWQWEEHLPHAEVMLRLYENREFKSLSGPEEHKACLLDSSSDSGGSGASIPKSLHSDSGSSSMPNVFFLEGGGGEPMGESELSLSSPTMVSTGRQPIGRGGFGVKEIAMRCGLHFRSFVRLWRVICNNKLT